MLQRDSKCQPAHRFYHLRVLGIKAADLVHDRWILPLRTGSDLLHLRGRNLAGFFGRDGASA